MNTSTIIRLQHKDISEDKFTSNILIFLFSFVVKFFILHKSPYELKKTNLLPVIRKDIINQLFKIYFFCNYLLLSLFLFYCFFSVVSVSSRNLKKIDIFYVVYSSKFSKFELNSELQRYSKPDASRCYVLIYGNIVLSQTLNVFFSKLFFSTWLI